MNFNFSEIKQHENLGLLAKQLVDGYITGLHKSPFHGFSVEFAEHKFYNYGESTKHIDWKVFARSDKLFTKQYEEETNLRCRIVIDNSSSMHYPCRGKDKLRFSVYTAAALSYLLVKQRDVVGLSVFSESIEYETEQRSTFSHLNKLMATLSKLGSEMPKSRTNIPEVLHQIADKSEKRSLIIIFSDMFQDNQEEEALFNALQHLKHNKHEVILFHVSDYESELNFAFEDRPYRFIDLETNEHIKVNPQKLKDTYKERMTSYYQNLNVKCGMMKIDFVPVNTKESFEKVVSRFLVKRKKMK